MFSLDARLALVYSLLTSLTVCPSFSSMPCRFSYLPYRFFIPMPCMSPYLILCWRSFRIHAYPSFSSLPVATLSSLHVAPFSTLPVAPRTHPCLSPRTHPSQSSLTHPCLWSLSHPFLSSHSHPCLSTHSHPTLSPPFSSPPLPFSHPCLSLLSHPNRAAFQPCNSPSQPWAVTPLISVYPSFSSRPPPPRCHPWMPLPVVPFSSLPAGLSFSNGPHQVVTKRCRLSLLTNSARPSKWAQMRGGWGGGGGGLRGLSQWVQLNIEAQINFGDLTPYLTYGPHHSSLSRCRHPHSHIFYLLHHVHFVQYVKGKYVSVFIVTIFRSRCILL